MDHQSTSPGPSDEASDEAMSQPDEYARQNDLSVDSLVNPLSLQLSIYGPNDGHPHQPLSDASLPQLHIPFLLPRNERLSASKASLGLLKKSIKINDMTDEQLYPSDHATFVSLTKLKLEPPMLHSDPDYDCRELARSVRSQRQARMHQIILPLEPLNLSNDEGLDFPESAHLYKQELIDTVREEKIDAPRGTLLYLAHVLRKVWTDDDERKLLGEELSPLAQDASYFIPDDPVCQVPIASDPSTLLGDDLDVAESNLIVEDGTQNEMPVSSQPSTPKLSPLEDLPMLTPSLPKLSSIRVDRPLTPLDPLAQTSDMLPDISELAKDMNIDQVPEGQQLVEFESDFRDPRDPEGAFSDSLLSMLEENAANVMRSIEQEQIEAADATARIDVPIMDFSTPEPEWETLPPDATSHWKWLRRAQESLDIPHWPKDHTAEKQLCWIPFPTSMGRMSTEESIDDDGHLEVLLDIPKLDEVPTSANYVWKQPGLAILREVEDDAENDGTIFDMDGPLLAVAQQRGDDRDLDSLVRKRRRDMVSEDSNVAELLSSPEAVDLVQYPEGPTAKPNEIELDRGAQLPGLLLDRDDPSATSTLLSNYIDFRTAKRQKHTTSSFFPTSTKPAVKLPGKETPANPKPDQRVSIASPLPEKDTELKAKLTTPAPCPTMSIPGTHTKIIKALTLSRGLFSRLEKLYPNAEIIERDFDRYNTTAWNRNSISRSPVVSSLAAEADIIVSPATGIIVTTLLRSMQKPLPGHKGQAAIRERISNVALRYERLIILVSEANHVDETARDLTPTECAAYADFAGFIAALNTDTQTYYIGGGEDTLAKWLVMFIARHAPEAAAMQDQVIQDETLWELFLRRAGMNAYAAQAVLGQLKAPDGAAPEDAFHFGLPAFVRLTAAEKVQDFRGLLGGERVLERVNKALQARWS